MPIVFYSDDDFWGRVDYDLDGFNQRLTPQPFDNVTDALFTWGGLPDGDQLAYAILRRLMSPSVADKLKIAFTSEIIDKLPEKFRLNSTRVYEWVGPAAFTYWFNQVHRIELTDALAKFGDYGVIYDVDPVARTMTVQGVNGERTAYKVTIPAKFNILPTDTYEAAATRFVNSVIDEVRIDIKQRRKDDSAAFGLSNVMLGTFNPETGVIDHIRPLPDLAEFKFTHDPAIVQITPSCALDDSGRFWFGLWTNLNGEFIASSLNDLFIDYFEGVLNDPCAYKVYVPNSDIHSAETERRAIFKYFDDAATVQNLLDGPEFSFIDSLDTPLED